MAKKSSEMVHMCEKFEDTWGVIAVPKNSITTAHKCRKCGFTWKTIGTEPVICPSCNEQIQ
ncbi:hypothetical protein JW868_04125 [Candidatus Woesearchaeota archaeon]|nr:hypothetical protein [Candidatus Woesearchaeota archaeon]